MSSINWFATILMLLFISPSFQQCIPGVLNETSISLLPSSSSLAISFGNDAGLDIVCNVEQTTVPRQNFQYLFNNPSTSTQCPISPPTIGTEFADLDNSCLIPVQTNFSWPPSQDCFDRDVVGENDIFSSELRFSWEESFNLQGIDFIRPVSVEFNVQVSIPNTITVTSDFVTSSTSTVNFITGFLIAGLSFELISPTQVNFTVQIGTITAKDNGNVLKISSLTPLDIGEISENGIGSSQADIWKQLWQWALESSCDGLSTTYSFRAEFSCADLGNSTINVNCSDSDYAGEFQDIDLSLTATSVCPSTNVGDFKAIATLELKNEDGQVVTTFSNLDAISAQISEITNEQILTSATVTAVSVNGQTWEDGIQFILDDTDVKHPILNFSPTATLIADGFLNDGVTAPNTISITLSLDWNQGGINKRDTLTLRALRTLPLAGDATATKKFEIVQVDEPVLEMSGANELTVGIWMVMMAIGFLF